MPSNWKKYKLNDVAEIIMGQSPSGDSCSENSDHGLPLLNGPTEFGYSYPTPAQYTNDSRKNCEVEDVLFCVRGSTTGRMNYADRIYSVGRGLAAIRGKNSYSTKFIKYLIDLHLPQMLNITTGSTFPNLSREALNDFPIEVPDAISSNVIAEILSSLDDKIELNLQANKTLEEMANLLYKQWFVNFVPFKNGQFAESELGMIPADWELKKVNQLYNITIGRTPPRKEQEWFSENPDDVKWISIRDMGIAGTYIYTTSEYLTKEAVAKFSVPKIPTNTVVLSFKLTVGRITITTEEMLSNEAIAHFIPSKDNYLTTEFAYLFLKNFNYDSLGSTSSIATAVNSQTIKNINILLPDKMTINSFQTSIGNLFEKIKQNTIESENLKQTRDYLLPKLISGEIRIKDAIKKVKEVA